MWGSIRPYAHIGPYLALLVPLVALGYSVPLYLALLAAFLLAARGLWILRQTFVTDLRTALVVVLLLAVVTRGAMLLHDQDITRDMEKYVERSDHALSGRTPYEDFEVRKPPMYLYLGMGIASAFGPDIHAFRAFFVGADALVAIAVLLLGWRHRSPAVGAWAGVLYALCPLNIVAIGLSGHYDPIVVLLVTAGLMVHLSGGRYRALLLLGIAFSLKYYSAVLLPFLLLDRSWRERTAGLALFLAPFALSWLPLTLIDPGIPLRHTLGYQGGQWASEAKKSFAYTVVEVSGTGGSAIVVSYIVTLVMLLVLLTFILTAIVDRSHHRDPLTRFVVSLGRRLRRALRMHDDGFHSSWLGAIIFLLLLYYGVVAVGALHQYRDLIPFAWPWLALVLTVTYFPAMLAAYRRLRSRIDVPTPDGGARLLLDVTFALVLFLLALPNLTPWYLLWALPTVLVVSDLNHHALLVLLPWNVPGRGP